MDPWINENLLILFTNVIIKINRMIHFDDNDVSNYDLMSSLVATQDTRDRRHHNSTQILKPLENVIRQK